MSLYITQLPQLPLLHISFLNSQDLVCSSISQRLSLTLHPSSKTVFPWFGQSIISKGQFLRKCFSIRPLSSSFPHLFLHFTISFEQTVLMCSSIVLKGSRSPHRSLHGTIRYWHSCVSWKFRFLRSTGSHKPLPFEQETSWYSHLFWCFCKSPFLKTLLHFSFVQRMLSSFTSLRIGMFGTRSLFIDSFISKWTIYFILQFILDTREN